VAILGANGAGKTTLLNSIAGLVAPTAGSIRFHGVELLGLPAHRIVEEGVATVTENGHLFGSMSVMENLVLGAYPRRARDAAPAGLARVLELFPRLAERRRQAVRTLSGGEQQMVARVTRDLSRTIAPWASPISGCDSPCGRPRPILGPRRS
jgi:branched-chain amino acid transport system ATP-binding protein